MARPQQPELAPSGKTDIAVPVDNQPGHHPAKEQDKPDLAAFAAKLGTDPTAPSATKARKGSRPKAAAAKAAPPKITTTPAKQPAAAPRWPESAPAADDLGPLPDAAGISAPQPEPPTEREPIMVALAMLPLRETVRRLELLERSLTERLLQKKGSA